MDKHYRSWFSVGVSAISLVVLLAPAQVQASDACWSHDETRFQHMSRSGHTGEVYGGDVQVPEQRNGAYQIQEEPFGSTVVQEGEGLWEELKVRSRSGIINCESECYRGASLITDLYHILNDSESRQVFSWFEGQDRAHELFISVCTEGIQIYALKDMSESPYDFAASPSKPMSTVDPKHGALCKSGPDDLSSRNFGNTLRDSKSVLSERGGVVSYRKGALTRNLGVEDAHGLYLFTYKSTGRDRQSAGDTGLLVRY